jgi:hypothetical protein
MTNENFSKNLTEPEYLRKEFPDLTDETDFHKHKISSRSNFKKNFSFDIELP